MNNTPIKIFFPAFISHPYRVSDEGLLEAIKFIFLKFRTINRNEIPYSDVLEVATTLTKILQNTIALWDKNGDFLGCINTYIGDSLLLDHEPEPTTPYSSLSKTFVPKIQKTDLGWEIDILPLKRPNFDEVDLYSLNNLHRDMWMIVGAWKYIAKKLQVNSEVKDWEFKIFLIENVPCVELFYGFFSIQYDMYNRILCARAFPDMDKWVLGQGLHTVNDLIDQVSKKEPNSKWLKNVDNFIDSLE